jgi:hypothetical protein
MTIGIAHVEAGICGMSATIRATSTDQFGPVTLEIESDCPHIGKLAEELTEVDPFVEIAFSGEGSKTLRLAAKYCRHAACPVPAGIIKAIEVTSGLALPKDVKIEVSQE